MKSAEVNVAESKAVPIQVWHEKLGHANYKSILELANGEAVTGIKCNNIKKSCKYEDNFCEDSIFGK